MNGYYYPEAVREEGKGRRLGCRKVTIVRKERGLMDKGYTAILDSALDGSDKGDEGGGREGELQGVRKNLRS